MTAAGSNVYAAWVSQTKLVAYDPKAPRVLYVRTNTNHGSTTAWQSAVRVSSATGRVDYPAIAASGNSVYVTYTDANTGNVRLATSRDRGATWTYRTLGVGHVSSTGSNGRAAYPSMAVSGTRVDRRLDEQRRLQGRRADVARWRRDLVHASDDRQRGGVGSHPSRPQLTGSSSAGRRRRVPRSGPTRPGRGGRSSRSAQDPSPRIWRMARRPSPPSARPAPRSPGRHACRAVISRRRRSTSSGPSPRTAARRSRTSRSVAYVEQRVNWSPSIVWAKADARHVLYEQDTSELVSPADQDRDRRPEVARVAGATPRP